MLMVLLLKDTVSSIIKKYILTFILSVQTMYILYTHMYYLFLSKLK